MRLFKDLTRKDKVKLLIESLINDGADEDTAKDTARNYSDPDIPLRDMFGYDNDTEI